MKESVGVEEEPSCVGESGEGRREEAKKRKGVHRVERQLIFGIEWHGELQRLEVAARAQGYK